MLLLVGLKKYNYTPCTWYTMSCTMHNERDYICIASYNNHEMSNFLLIIRIIYLSLIPAGGIWHTSIYG